ncbi:succinate-semialdehyde dehydrogenase / glutarate-semialdehyde dehydrogenase [Amphritea atlantica]|uniref:Succinate-semialdehyde dehydrogenase / glutarate-semialdehyde dehydrogenase n=1 Tax=Amphritea atlantica TaxID=355243 RepID=A0A1H9IX65_9GAMM|nr:NAD-dependent succinate-semialdehyde dehydrogenase [Amphritea atlantica]SEQ79136.1 succinate-semialdehyde dehydrogenase / glutarate-semialdehyde dehydrogenase [Amphritea atlantica]
MLSLSNPELLKSSCFINGEWVGADSGDTIDVINPADDSVIIDVPVMGQKETEAAIGFAATAWKPWKKTTAKHRAQILRRWFDLIMANQDDLGKILSAEQGKPIPEAKGEIAYAASFIEWFSEEAKRTYGDVIPEVVPGTRLTVRKEPIGVCAAVTPWNFPAAMITRKAGPALAAGCPIIIKPASQTPLTAFALAYLAHEAGVPAGVLQVINGRSSEIGTALCENPTVRKLSFTGSTDIGKLLMQQCAANVKKVSLELGGNAPFIVFDDADLDKSVEGALIAKFRNNGQTCVCANRILVQSGVYDAFSAKLAAAVDKLVVADGATAGAELGPLIDRKAYRSIKAMIDDATAKGAVQITSRNVEFDEQQRFMNPVVLGDAQRSMDFYADEIFGPVAALFKFDSIDDAIEMANDTEYGLASYMYTQSISTYIHVSEALEYGMVGVNTGLISNEVAPFGGIKSSGIGREGSKYGIEDYLEIKYVCLGGL